jgi:hypothetical protein
MKRKCSVCKEVKNDSEFYKDKKGARGYGYRCKECAKSITIKWRLENPERSKEAIKNWEIRNREKGRIRSRKYLENHPERRRSFISRWKKANPEKVRESCKRCKERKLSTPQGNMNFRMAVSIRKALRDKKTGSWSLLIGYTVHDLIKHLESKFLPGMSWDNMNEWHIDHIIPQSAFHFETHNDIDFKKCWALSNLQPLWAKDNISKRDKLKKPFQPSLAMQV